MQNSEQESMICDFGVQTNDFLADFCEFGIQVSDYSVISKDHSHQQIQTVISGDSPFHNEQDRRKPYMLDEEIQVSIRTSNDENDQHTQT